MFIVIGGMAILTFMTILEIVIRIDVRISEKKKRRESDLLEEDYTNYVEGEKE